MHDNPKDMMQRTNRRQAVFRTAAMAALAVSTALGGCALAGLGGSSPPETYDLAAPTPKKGGARASVHISVASPSTIRPLDSDQILVRNAEGRLSYFPSSAWGDRLPKLVQTRLIQALTDSGRFRAVGSSQDRTPSDMTLNIELRSFNVQVEGVQAQAVIDVVVKLVDERRDRVVATKQFTSSAPASKDDAAAGVAALTQAFGKISDDIVAWSANPRPA